MKKLLLLFAVLITAGLQGQIPKKLRHIIPAPANDRGDIIAQLTCEPLAQNGCNFIRNPEFMHDAQYDPAIDFVNPFNIDYLGTSRIPFWNVGTGTPTIWDGVNFPGTFPWYPNPPAGSTGYFFGAAGLANYLGIYASESVVQKIPAMIPNHTYTLNFHKMYMDYTTVTGSNYPVDHFRVVLMHCSDYLQTFWTNINYPYNYEVPPLPANSQIIYCENNVFNGSWEKVFFKFIPNQNYDMIWIYPEEDHDNPNKETGIFVSYPELVDITNFTAGPPPNPTPPNCLVTIGPATPNCSPAGATFTWHGPSGQNIPVPATNQQIQVDANNPVNNGTWTLTMSLANIVTTNNSCSQNINSVSASVYVPSCTQTAVWPKVYHAKHPEYLRQDENGNVLLFLHDADVTAANLNHTGVLPSPPYTGEYTIPYTPAGITNYTVSHPGHRESFPLHSGDVQITEYSYPVGWYNIYFNGITGNPSPNPPSIPQDETILAESNSGTLITRTANYTALYVHTATYTSPPLATTHFDGRYVFNPATNNLFFLPKSVYHPFLVYHLDNTTNTLTQLYSLPYTGSFQFIHVDNQDQVYVLENNVVKKYDYTAVIPGTSSVSLSGFSNINSRGLTCNDPYTKDICLVMHNADNRIYALNFAALTSKSVAVSNTSHFYYEYYLIIGNSVYFTGCTTTSTASIGTQSIPELHPQMNSFITQLSLLGDFSKQTTETIAPERNNHPFSIQVIPNPATRTISLLLNQETGLNATVAYSIRIYSKDGNQVLWKEKYRSGEILDISRLQPGMYYIDITNATGAKLSKSLLKL